MQSTNRLNPSPQIQKMIVEGNLPSVMTLKRLYSEVPVEWERQGEGGKDSRIVVTSGPSPALIGAFFEYSYSTI